MVYVEFTQNKLQCPCSTLIINFRFLVSFWTTMEVYERGISYIKLWLRQSHFVVGFGLFTVFVDNKKKIKYHHTSFNNGVASDWSGKTSALTWSLGTSETSDDFSGKLCSPLSNSHAICTCYPWQVFYFDAVGADNIISQIQMYKSVPIQHIWCWKCSCWWKYNSASEFVFHYSNQYTDSISQNCTHRQWAQGHYQSSVASAEQKAKSLGR